MLIQINLTLLLNIGNLFTNGSAYRRCALYDYKYMCTRMFHVYSCASLVGSFSLGGGRRTTGGKRRQERWHLNPPAVHPVLSTTRWWERDERGGGQRGEGLNREIIWTRLDSTSPHYLCVCIYCFYLFILVLIFQHAVEDWCIFSHVGFLFCVSFAFSSQLTLIGKRKETLYQGEKRREKMSVGTGGPTHRGCTTAISSGPRRVCCCQHQPEDPGPLGRGPRRRQGQQQLSQR